MQIAVSSQVNLSCIRANALGAPALILNRYSTVNRFVGREKERNPDKIQVRVNSEGEVPSCVS